MESITVAQDSFAAIDLICCPSNYMEIKLMLELSVSFIFLSIVTCGVSSCWANVVCDPTHLVLVKYY